MNRRTRILLGIAAVVFFGTLAAILVPLLSRDADLELRVRDSVSRRWVWDLTLKLQDRELRSFYQSDTGLRVFRFTHLMPGKSSLQLSAPGYQPLSVPVTLRRGINRLATPLDMVGREIPGLGGFLMFETLDGSDIVVQVRPVEKVQNATEYGVPFEEYGVPFERQAPASARGDRSYRGGGGAILNHPCLDIWVGCRVFVQMAATVPRGIRENGTSPALAEAKSGWTRGAQLFRGRIPWTWDPRPEAAFRYSARIPGARMKQDRSGFRIIDYMVVVPDPLKITRSELDAFMARIETIDDPAAVSAALDAEKERLRWFTDTSWNVKVAQE
jgi:hypothetical protein